LHSGTSASFHASTTHGHVGSEPPAGAFQRWRFDQLRRQHRVSRRYPGGKSFLYSMTIAGCLLRHACRTWGLALPCSSLSGTSTSGVLAVRDSNLWCTIVLRCFHRKVVCRQRPGFWSLSAATMAVAWQTSTTSGCEASMVRAGHAVSYRPLQIRYPRSCRAEAGSGGLSAQIPWKISAYQGDRMGR
jgi:hypothetical protein